MTKNDNLWKHIYHMTSPGSHVISISSLVSGAEEAFPTSRRAYAQGCVWGERFQARKAGLTPGLFPLPDQTLEVGTEWGHGKEYIIREHSLCTWTDVHTYSVLLYLFLSHCLYTPLSWGDVVPVLPLNLITAAWRSQVGIEVHTESIISSEPVESNVIQIKIDQTEHLTSNIPKTRSQNPWIAAIVIFYLQACYSWGAWLAVLRLLYNFHI